MSFGVLLSGVVLLVKDEWMLISGQSSHWDHAGGNEKIVSFSLFVGV